MSLLFLAAELRTRCVSAHQLEGDIVAVSEIAAAASEAWRPVIDLDAPQSLPTGSPDGPAKRRDRREVV